jgi:hypothetical protein
VEVCVRCATCHWRRARRRDECGKNETYFLSFGEEEISSLISSRSQKKKHRLTSGHCRITPLTLRRAQIAPTMFALTCTTSRVAAAPGSAGADRAKLARVGSRASGSHSQASRIGRRVCLGGAGHGGRAVRTAATEGTFNGPFPDTRSREVS